MTNRYSYKDPIFKENAIHQNLRIESNNSILNVFRMISGTINCIDDYKNKEYRFRKNFSNLPYENNNRINQSILLDNFPEEVKLKDLNNYFRRSRFNASFYKDIESELIKCLIAEQKGDHLESFFYLYRILEGISYSLPLIYVSKNKVYDKTYKQLQLFFSKQQDGELAFFKRFLKDTFGEDNFFSTSIDIDINEIDIEEIRTDYYNLYIKHIKPNAIIDMTENEEIQISFIGFYEFLIELRNRFFHLKKGAWQDNLSSTELIFPDYFFKPIVHHGINWISIILFEVIKVDFEKGNN
ncbi:conserved hypothetical protein [Tenacibaculum dicentrarchi]|nr:conserved hypothetical protein [Tenacibaculum dicentrarchi]